MPMTPLQEFWHYSKYNKDTVAGLVYVIVMAIIAVLANLFAPHNPAGQFRNPLLAPPFWQDDDSLARLPGADDVGRDTSSRLMYDVRLSLLVGYLVAILSLVLGMVLGLVADYLGGVVDSIIVRVVDTTLALPGLLLVLVLVVIFGPSIVNAPLTLTFVALPHYMRLTRAAVPAEVNRGYVTASRVTGTGAMHQMSVNILPNCLVPLVIRASLGFSNTILDMVALGFLDMGAQSPTPE